MIHRIKYIPISLLALFILVKIMTTVQHGGVPAHTEPPDSPIFMRGCVTLVLRFNTIQPPQQIVVCDDSVGRIGNPPTRFPLTYVPMTSAEQTALKALRMAWCNTPPRFAMTTQTIRDDVGLRCTASYAVTQFQVPHDHLPALLQHFDDQLPPLR